MQEFFRTGSEHNMGGWFLSREEFARRMHFGPSGTQPAPSGKPFYRPVGAAAAEAAAEAAAMADQAGPSGSRPMRPGELLALQVAQLVGGALARGLSGQKLMPAMPKHPMQFLIEAMGLGDWKQDLHRTKALAFLAGGDQASKDASGASKDPYGRRRPLAIESQWLITGRTGVSADPQVSVARNTARTAKAAEAQAASTKRSEDLLKELLSAWRRKPMIKVVGANLGGVH